VVQEIALARQALIYCGTDTISWNKFAIAVELFVEVETATHRLSEVMQKVRLLPSPMAAVTNQLKDPKYYHVPGWFEYVSALGASLLVDATGRLFRDSKEEQTAENTATDGDESDSDVQSDSDYGSDADSTSSSVNDISHRAMPHFRRLKRATEVKKRGLPLLSLEYLVSSLSIFGTSGPHDTIYALLAIAKDTTPIAANTTMRQSSDHAQHVLEVFTQRKRYKVDYKLPYVDVCQGFIQFCIERSLQSDRSRALDVICRPWATEEKVLEQIRRAEERERKRERKRQERETPGRNYNTRKVSSRTVDQLSPEDPYESPTFETPRKSNTLYSDNSKVVEFEEAKAKELSLPSWVPQLTGAPFGMYEKAGIDGITMSRKNADPLVGYV
jgi:hypothetical protein